MAYRNYLNRQSRSSYAAALHISVQAALVTSIFSVSSQLQHEGALTLAVAYACS